MSSRFLPANRAEECWPRGSQSKFRSFPKSFHRLSLQLRFALTESKLMETKSFGDLTPVGGGDPIPLLKTKLTLGRRNSCDVTLRFANVSSQHCELELINGYWRVRDLNSSNGIRVNSVRCDEKFLFPGDVLAVGKHKFEITYEAVGERPQEDDDPFAKSLMEKAGLVNSERSQARRQSAEKVDTDDDLALQWLLGKQ